MGATRDDLFEEILYDYDICEFLTFALDSNHVDTGDIRNCVDDWEIEKEDGRDHERHLQEMFKKSR